jgi:hypothetical protein
VEDLHGGWRLEGGRRGGSTCVVESKCENEDDGVGPVEITLGLGLTWVALLSCLSVESFLPSLARGIEGGLSLFRGPPCF